MAYDLYPAVDDTYNFPVEIRRALAASQELRSLVIPMTTTLRNNLTAAEKWDGRVIANTTIDRLERYDAGTTAWLPIAEQSDILSFVNTAKIGRNRFLNGDLAVKQRALTTGSMVAANLTICDRWTGTAANGTVTMTAYQHPSNAPSGLPEQPFRYLQVSIAGHGAASDHASISQVIEGVSTLAGKTVTLSFWAGSPNIPKVAIEIQQQMGVGGGTAVYLPKGIIALTGGGPWTRYSATFDIPYVNTNRGAGHSLNVVIWLSAGANFATRSSNLGSQNGQISFWGFQLEEGNGATVFEQQTFIENKRACRRYYQTYDVVNGWSDTVTPGFYHCHPDGLYEMFNDATAGMGVTGTCSLIRAVGSGGIYATNPAIVVQPFKGTIYYSNPGGNPTPGAWLEFEGLSLTAAI